MTGLALLCYMAHGETPASKEFGKTVEKAIRYLMYNQNADGTFNNCGDNYVYGHAIAAYALAESYSMTRIVMLKDPAERAIQVIIDGQQDNGRWDYNYSKGDRSDISVTGWQVQASKAAKIAELGNPDLQRSLDMAVSGIKQMALPGGGFSYEAPPTREHADTLTGAGILCLSL